MQLQYEADLLAITKEERVTRLPFIRRFPFADGWTDEQYTELLAEWNIYAPHEVPEMRSDPAEAAVIALQRELIRNVGDDVATGFVAASTGGANQSVQLVDRDMRTVAPPPSMDQMTNPVAPMGTAFTIGGRAFSLPLKPNDVDELRAIAADLRAKRDGGSRVKMVQPTLGTDNGCIDFETRVLRDCDLTIPMSAEAGGDTAATEATSAVSGVVLGHLREFQVPQRVADDIAQRLCPDADGVIFKPYRLDFYDRGDALACSTLPVQEEDEVGKVVVHLPLEMDYIRAMSRMMHKNMDICFDPDRKLGSFENGEQRFYVGRTFETLNEEIPLEVIHNMKDVGFDRPCAAAVLETRVALAEYTAIEVTNAEGIRPMRYVAWGPDVVFEALPVVDTPIIALRYRVYRQRKRQVWRIPNRGYVVQLAEAAFAFMAMRPPPRSNVPEYPHETQFLQPKNIGIVLRHTYEPREVLKALEDPRQVLKRLDAVTYRLLSGRYECRVLPAIVYKSDCHCAAWRVQEFPHRFVFTSLKGYPELREEIGRALSDAECMPLLVSALELTISNCLWAQIGNGRLLGGGGNAYDECVCDSIPDCGTDWWYQNAVLVVTPEPARWARRRPLFAIRERSVDRTDAPVSNPRSLAGALAHWNIFEITAMFL